MLRQASSALSSLALADVAHDFGIGAHLGIGRPVVRRRAAAAAAAFRSAACVRPWLQPLSPVAVPVGGSVTGVGRLPALLAVLDHHVGVDAAAHVPARGDADEARRDRLDDVVEHGVGHLLVERAFVAVAPEVQLQALQLDAQLVGHDVDREVREVRLPGQRAQAGELGQLEADQVVALRRRVREDLQVLARQRGRYRGRLALACGGAEGLADLRAMDVKRSVRHRENEGARCYHPRPLHMPVPAPAAHGLRYRSSACRALLLAAAGPWALAGCMSLPDVSQRPWDRAVQPDAQRVRWCSLQRPRCRTGELSGFRLVSSGAEALQLRLALIERATQLARPAGLPVQERRLGARADARAARRRRRVACRCGCLLDDLYTAGDDALWLGLAALPGVELRLFNPFLSGRDSHVGRLLESALGDERLHRRMHNKLLVADGALALAGGRNIADAYFLPAAQGSFVDIDVLVAGPAGAADDAGLRPVLEQRLQPRAAQCGRRTAGCSRAPSPQLAQAPRLSCSDHAPATAVEQVRARRPALAAAPSTRVDCRCAWRMASVAYDSPAKIENEQVAIGHRHAGHHRRAGAAAGGAGHPAARAASW